jgi:hypothetical protein
MSGIARKRQTPTVVFAVTLGLTLGACDRMPGPIKIRVSEVNCPKDVSAPRPCVGPTELYANLTITLLPETQSGVLNVDDGFGHWDLSKFPMRFDSCAISDAENWKCITGKEGVGVWAEYRSTRGEFFRIVRGENDGPNDPPITNREAYFGDPFSVWLQSIKHKIRF